MHDIATAAVLACLLEVSAPKPGNVNRFRDFADTKYEHFLASASAMYKPFLQAAESGFALARGEREEAEIGYFIRECVKRAREWHTGGNTNLGIAMLIIPLCTGAGYVVAKQNKIDIEYIIDYAKNLVVNSTSTDAINLYKAIRLANPGGLNKVNKMDVFDDQSFEIIIKNKLNMYDVLKIAEYDLIAQELYNGYKITFEYGYKGIMKYYSETKDLNFSILKTFLEILADHEDSLIVRKVSKEKASEISRRAKEVLEKGIEEDILSEFDSYLREKGNLYNPGASADIIAASLFLCLLGGLRP